MTRDRANEILFLWKVGAELFPSTVINTALYLTGDLSGPDLEAEPRMVCVPGVPTWVEGTSLALGEGVGERASGDLLEVAGAAGGANATRRDF
jgi:hypothetical protein